MTAVLNEEDYSGRDALSIFVELELLEMIQTPKVEAVIKRIYNSDYDQSGTLFQMSTPYQVIFGDKNQIEDVETDYRFYKQRSINSLPQSEWLFDIFKDSMNAKIKALGGVVVMFVIFSVIEFELVIQVVSVKKPILSSINSIHHKLVLSHDEHEILDYIHQCDELFDNVKNYTDELYSSFLTIEIICTLNLTFLIQDIVNFIFSKVMGRFYQFPTV